MLLSHLAGKTRVGTAKARTTQDIVIRGTGVLEQHCYLLNENDVVTLYPLADMTSVDGVKVTAPTRLSQGE